MAMRTAFPLAALAFMIFAPQVQAADCHCKLRTSHASHRYLHRPSTDEERAETARLNREFLSAARAPAPAIAPVMRQAQQAQPAPPPQGSPLEQYLELRRAYDRQLWAYYRAFPPPARTYAQAPPPAPLTHARPDETYGQDAARLDPWHGYNPRSGLANGY
jgi:hypothetical protein